MQDWNGQQVEEKSKYADYDPETSCGRQQWEKNVYVQLVGQTKFSGSLLVNEKASIVQTEQPPNDENQCDNNSS